MRLRITWCHRCHHVRDVGQRRARFATLQQLDFVLEMRRVQGVRLTFGLCIRAQSGSHRNRAMSTVRSIVRSVGHHGRNSIGNEIVVISPRSCGRLGLIGIKSYLHVRCDAVTWAHNLQTPSGIRCPLRWGVHATSCATAQTIVDNRIVIRLRTRYSIVCASSQCELVTS